VHTSASDGRCDAAELIRRAADAGLTTLSITDHDTTASVAPAAALGVATGITVVPGIEITSVWQGLDVHVLGYFFNPASPVLAAFLERQRSDRVERLHLMAARLADLGSPVDVAALVEGAASSCPDSFGRPHLARVLVETGHARDVADAFERFLRSGAPAFVPRRGPSPFDAVRMIDQAGGLSSLAHPGSLGRDELIPELAAAGLQAVEAWHPDHSPAAVEHYRRLAGQLGLGVTGGSDYHGDPEHGAPSLGGVLLPPEEYEALRARHRHRTHHDHHHHA
jgi:3',5'-nucleoside bisphosphate phosphatase